MRVLKVGWAVLLLVAMVNSVPTEEVVEQDTEGAGDDGDLDVESMLQNLERTRALQDAGAEEDAEDEDPDGSEKDNAISEKENKDRAEEQNKNNFISQGNTIALQTYVRNLYLGCRGGRCNGNGCPHMDMSGNDWSRCWGQVFEIYRHKGPGVVRSGDLVGLHYPRERGKWLNCAGGHHLCGKAPCPGRPTMRHGFKGSGQWHSCWQEVFRIFAKGKSIGTPIQPQDDVSLLLPRMKSWVSQCSGHTRARSCLGTSLPPSLSKFDFCACETFKIYKKMKC